MDSQSVPPPLRDRAYAAYNWECDVSGAACTSLKYGDARHWGATQLQEYLIASGVALDLSDEEMAALEAEYPREMAALNRPDALLLSAVALSVIGAAGILLGYPMLWPTIAALCLIAWRVRR